MWGGVGDCLSVFSLFFPLPVLEAEEPQDRQWLHLEIVLAVQKD